MKQTAILLRALLAVPVWAGEKPNIIIVVADDLGYADAGFQGCKDIPTPHLDALAADPNEAKPLKVADVTGPTATAAKKLQSALDTFKDACHGELDQQFRNFIKKK